MRFLIGLTVAALAACTPSVGPAAPPRIERIVAFGDSYADNGNIYRLFGAQPPSMYPRGRFSNGTNFVDTMAALMKVPAVNFALGGAVAGEGRNNRPAGFATEYRAFLAGGGPDYFPRVSGRLSGSDLVVVSIGGNDARRYEKTVGPEPTRAKLSAAIAAAPAAADVAVRETAAGLDALVGAGARNLLFLGGDVGRLPEAKGAPFAPVGTAFSSRYNAGVQALLAGYAKRGVTVHYLDLSRLGDRIEADPAAFGLASAGACPQACLTDPALADKYLFYVDKLHFTSAGFAIVGREAVALLAR
jgi:outer membrane lipase/esterase